MESAVADHLIGIIVSLLENEASLIGGVYDALDELKLELKTMTSFIQDAERKRGLTQVEKDWVANVQDMCSPVEIIIEEFMYHLNKQKRDGKLTKFFYGVIHIPKNLLVRHRVAKKIQKINTKIKSISERNQRYGVTKIEGATSSREEDDDQRRAKNQGESLVFTKDNHLVGVEDDQALLLEWLTNDEQEQERTVISVVGMGGSGKSALVAKVYNNPIVKRHFHCYAWITISQTYAIDDVLKRTMKKFYGDEKRKVPLDLSSMSYIDLLKVLVEYLQGKRYLLVVDDVWKTNLWKELKASLPNEGLGSRVILTTRNEEIATAYFGVQSHVHRIKPLNQSGAWELFRTTAFSSYPNRSCPEELRNIALDLIKKCGGLPLAILALAGALFSKKKVSEWIDFSASLNHELNNNDDLEEMKQRILLFRFRDLPYHLKRCFLYCCIFPEDYPFGRMRLVRLWIVEGFVEEARAKTPERIAEEYLEELVHRNMLQVVNYHRSGRLGKCKMHDMMRELALSLSEKERFCAVYDGLEGNQEMSKSARRLSIQKGVPPKDTKSFNGFSQLRSLFVFATDMIHPSSSTDTMPSGFRLLRVLDLKGVPVEKLPNEVADLFNLRYLNLKRTMVKELPKSIGRLGNLQTLDIRYSEIRVLPTGIVKLKKLRHLLMYRYDYTRSRDFECLFGTLAPSSICKLKNLQVLAGVDAEPSLVKQLKYMTQLTRIGIFKLRKEYEEDLWTAVESMKLLNYLFVMVADEEECLGMDALSSPPPCIEMLQLCGKLEKVPNWFHSLQSLTTLSLHWSRLGEDPLPHIQTLVNLSDLRLSNAYTGDQLCFSAGFNKLTQLWLYNLPRLNEVTVNKGVMPSLRELQIRNCRELKKVPRGIEHLTHLQELSVINMPTEFIESIRGEESVDRPRVRHIPVIKHFYEKANGFVVESLSRFD